ncbi:MAG: transcriptional repressor [Erysipelotrichaceae bacterium]|jgi:Fur family ferric uptake transcriptional regulator|nr:transcriptional repressor [Erysipelotrichaceae bacterium]
MDEKEILREHGLKATPARVETLRYLSSLNAPISADDLFERLRHNGLDLSTLYRTLNSLSSVGLVKKEVGARKENLFSLEREEERHLLVCLRCGKKIPLEGCPYHEVNESIEEKTGFRVLDHNTEIYGICPDCR